uniref:Uncharacterized protein MANES_04G130100 n=1 Tax=Rhizophora mucronata TaxID=61149 RepID=A0A2P2PJ16_RHIMU
MNFCSLRFQLNMRLLPLEDAFLTRLEVFLPLL